MEQVRVGDRLVVESERVGAPAREGKVIEVLGKGDGVHYSVRWDDGHTSIFFPSVGSAEVIHRRKVSAR